MNNRDMGGLPPEIPADNQGFGESGRDGAAFAGAPDVATPQFGAAPRRDAAAFARETRLGAAELADAKPQRQELMSKERQNLTILIAVVALAMALAAVFRVYNPGDQTPLCSEQPDWNQYNCRAG